MRRALGKGLSQLIADQSDTAPSEIELSSIVPNKNQPRTSFDQELLQELADSMREVGLLQPVIVRPIAEGKYELIAGERRFRAAVLAGMERIPAIVRAAGNQSSLELALIENIQREDITPLQCARAYRRLSQEFGLKQEEIASKVGKSRAAIANSMRLLKLPTEIQEALESNQISEGHAKVLLGIVSPAKQLAVFERILDTGMSVREAEKLAKPAPGLESTRGPKLPSAAKDPNLEALEEALSTYLGSPAAIKRGTTGGKLVIQFYSDEDLERIVQALGVQV